MHPGNPKAILIAQNLIKNSMKINNYTIFFTIIKIIIITYSLIFISILYKKKTCILDSFILYTIFLNLNIFMYFIISFYLKIFSCIIP